MTSPGGGAGAATAKDLAVQYSCLRSATPHWALLAGPQHVTACGFQAWVGSGRWGGVLADSVVEARSAGEFFSMLLSSISYICSVCFCPYVIGLRYEALWN